MSHHIVQVSGEDRYHFECSCGFYLGPSSRFDEAWKVYDQHLAEDVTR